MKRYYLIFQGRVQGVGFRSFLKMQALQYNCTGWAKNLTNGNVEAMLQGNEEQIKTILRNLKKGNMFIRITDYSIKEIPIMPNEQTFSIHY